MDEYPVGGPVADGQLQRLSGQQFGAEDGVLCGTQRVEEDGHQNQSDSGPVVAGDLIRIRQTNASTANAAAVLVTNKGTDKP
ncbi:MAG: hypothetical protein ABW115_21210, partial [Candidatus Thiodiazotropha sp. 6PLUC6]